MQSTYVPRQRDLTTNWYIVDAENKVLGRVAVEVARVLRGKHRPTYTPHLDLGDHVVIINADKVRVTGDKLNSKVYYHHSGYPGGLRETQLKQLMAERPERVLEIAVRGMLPKNRLGRQLFRKLRVYRGAEHPHTAQKPQVLNV